jgi:hypothetical protein
VTTGPDGSAGVLGEPGTEVLFGAETIDSQARPGGRITISRWLEDEEESVLEFVGFYVADDYHTGDFARESPGSPVLARPFVNVGPNGSSQDSELVASDTLSGRIAIDSYSEIYSAAGLLRCNVGLGPRGRVDLLGGYRYFRLRESLAIREDLVFTSSLLPEGTTADVRDQFAATNDFHGGELGIAAEFYLPRMSIELLAKVALGGTIRKVVIDGQTTFFIPDVAPDIAPGGLLTQPTNMGTHRESAFSVLPEFGVSTVFAVTPNLSFTCGYSLILLNDALRTGSQIDRGVNISQLGGETLDGPARPGFAFRRSDFVLQGISLGLEYAW